MVFNFGSFRNGTNLRELNNKAPFFTAGELLDKYLLKQEKISSFGAIQFNYIHFRRRYQSLLDSLVLLYRSNPSFVKRDFNSESNILSRIYFNNLSSIWWKNTDYSLINFNYSKMFFSLNTETDSLSEKISFNTFLAITSVSSKFLLTLLDETFMSKLFAMIDRSIWAFVPYSSKSISGGTSYLSLAIGQIPNITVDYMLTLAQPDDILHNIVKFGSARYFELYIINFIISKFGTTWIDLQEPSSTLAKHVLSLYVNVLPIFKKTALPLHLGLFERLLFIKSFLSKKHSHELNQLEYFETASSPFEVFLKTWVNLFDERIRFLDSLYDIKIQKQIYSVWTNYLVYLEMHEMEAVVLDHKDIPAYQQGLILIWGFTNFKSLTLSRIRVTNFVFRNYLHAYESLKFSREINYLYEIMFVDEITEESHQGYFDVVSFLDEFYDEGFEFMEEEIPYVYHWDDEDDSSLGVIFPYAYLEIFNDQFEFSTYYYQTDEMARNYTSMQLYKPYNLAAHGYEWLVPNNETDMAWFNALFYTSLHQESEMDLLMFKDHNSEETWKIKSLFDRTLKIPTTTIFETFIDERSVDLSLLAVSRSMHMNTLTTYSVDSLYDLYLGPQKHTIVSQRYDSWFPTFISTKFRRV